ncbi:MAG: discoidin domain-containing protein [Pyrinomonadaceae bacterium]|nr:discoidin domain-containing protein [Pyrinomonadaceae bacterium]
MKQCPQCHGRYADDSLNFCLQDGATLTFVSDTPSSRNSDATLIYGSLDSERGSTVVDPAPKPPPKFIAQPTLLHDARVAVGNPGISSSHPTSRLLVGGVLAIAVLLLVSVGIGAALLFRQSRQNQPAASGPNAPSPNPASATPSQGTSTTKGLTSGPGIESEQNTKTAPLKIKATASSVRYSVQSNTYDPSNAIDGNKGTAWIEGVDGPGPGEWIRFDFDREINLHRILILPGYFKSPAIWAMNNRISAATLDFSGGTSRLFKFPDRMERHTLDVGSIRTRWVRIKLEDFYLGKDPDTPISEVAFEWEP